MQLPWKRKSDLDIVIDEVTMLLLGKYDPADEEYERLLRYREHLTKIRNEERNARRRVSPDTIAIVLGNVFIAAIVVLAERDSVVSDKFKSFLTRSKN